MNLTAARVNRLRSENGQTAAEFALVAPIILVLVLGAIQFGYVFNTWVTLTDAARAGARKAIVARFNGGSTTQASQAVYDSASSLDPTKLSVTVADDQWNTPGSQVTVTASYPYTVNIPLIGVPIMSGNLTATAKERLE
jgi:Flp pilus assembly protein TadG